MGRLTSRLVQSAQRIGKQRNKYGDIIYQPTVTLPCLYRDISILTRGNSNVEEYNIDGQLWFDGDVTIQKGEVYLLEGNYYRIEKVIIAKRRLVDNTTDFIKCEVTRQRQIS